MIKCPDLENPDNGVVDDGDNLPGTKAVYKCNDGYRLVGQAGVSVNVTALGKEGLLCANVSINTIVKITKASSTDQNVK